MAGEATQGVGERAAGLTGADHADIGGIEHLEFGFERLAEAFAGAQALDQAGQQIGEALALDHVGEKAQRLIQGQAGAEHHRKLAGEHDHLILADPPALPNRLEQPGCSLAAGRSRSLVADRLDRERQLLPAAEMGER